VHEEIDEAKGTELPRTVSELPEGISAKRLGRLLRPDDSKGDRLKRPSEQPNRMPTSMSSKRKRRIVVSGVKMSITQVAYADEMLFFPPAPHGG